MQAPAWRRYLRFWRPDVDGDIDDELRFHFDERVADLVARGRSRVEAHAEALREFGDVSAVRAELHDIDARIEKQRERAGWLDALRQDLRYALRSLARARGLTTMIVITLALGFGVNVAMFSFLEQVYVRSPDGVRAPHQVHRLWTWHFRSATPSAGTSVNYRQYRAISEAVRPLAQMAAYTFGETDIGLARKADVAWVDANFLPLLGAHAQLGRFFQRDEDVMGAGAPVVVISDALWHSAFGGDSAIVGRHIRIVGKPYTIVGVAQAGFSGIDLDGMDVWAPLADFPRGAGGDVPWYREDQAYYIDAIVRVPRAVDVPVVESRATAALKSAMRQMQWPDTSATAELGPINRARGPGTTRQVVSIATRLAGVALIVLLIACANVTNLFLARAMQRGREFAIRQALGISRRRLTALIVLEALLLSGAGAIAALLVSLWGSAALRSLLNPDTHWAGGTLDSRIAVGTALLALACGLVVGLAPALRAGRADVGSALKAGAREGTYHRSRLRAVLLAAQAALSVLLLVGAGLFVRSLRQVEGMDIGYDSRDLLFVSANFVGVDHKVENARDSTGLPRVAERLRRIPGVEDVALTTVTPLFGFGFNDLVVPGVDSAELTKILPTFTAVSPEYFATTGIRFMRGRAFTDADVPGAAPVVIVNETMARRLWPRRDALGACVILGKRGDTCRTVVGIVADSRRSDLVEKPILQYYAPLAQAPAPWVPHTAIVRVPPSHAAIAEREAQRIVKQELPGSYPWIHSMTSILEPHYRPWRLGAMLFTAFGLLALVVAAVGVHSTLSYTFSQRTHEIGVRMALGARASDIVRLVVTEGVRVVAIGIGIGIALTLVLGRFVESLLYGVSPHDPATLAGMTVVLLGVAALAALLPARRAVHVDPLRALREE